MSGATRRARRARTRQQHPASSAQATLQSTVSTARRTAALCLVLARHLRRHTGANQTAVAGALTARVFMCVAFVLSLQTNTVSAFLSATSTISRTMECECGGTTCKCKHTHTQTHTHHTHTHAQTHTHTHTHAQTDRQRHKQALCDLFFPLLLPCCSFGFGVKLGWGVVCFCFRIPALLHFLLRMSVMLVDRMARCTT